MTKVSKREGIWPSPFGATATGLALVGGQITLEELQTCSIEHVMGIALDRCAADTIWSWPAQRSDGKGCLNSPYPCIPEGAWFRLNPTIDVDSLKLPPVATTIARAAQQYGFVVWDKSSTISLRCTNPLSYTQPNALPPADLYAWLFQSVDQWNVLNNFPWKEIQFLDAQPLSFP